MATVNITYQPEHLTPTHYPIIWKFDETNAGGGGTFNQIFFITGPVTNGQTFSFWIGNTDPNGPRITLIARDNPSNGDIPSSASSFGTLDDITFAIVDTLNSNSSFSPFYTATYFGGGSGIFTISVVTPGNIWNSTYEMNLGTIPDVGTAIFGLPSNQYFSQGTNSFSVFLDYYDLTNDTTTKYATTPIANNGIKKARFLRSKNDENEYYFDISDFTKGFVNDNYVPLLRTNVFHYLDGAVNAYNIVYGFQYTSGSTFNRIVKEGEVLNNWIINSSIPFNIQDDSFLEYQTYSARTFLTNQPRAGKVVDLYASNPLACFHYNTGSTSFNVVASIELTFTDGNVLSALTGHHFATSIPTDKVIYADVGPANIPIAGLENLYQREIASYDIWFQRKVLTTYTDELTERITFILDRSCKDNPKYIHWKNELGGLDSWTFNGKTNQTTDIEQSIFSRFESNPNDKLVPTKATGKIKKATKINCSSGWMDEAHYNWMRDSLVGSPAVWINETGNVMERIVIVDLTVQKDSDNLMHNILITFEKSNYENHIGR